MNKKIKLKENEKEAITELKKEVLKKFPSAKFMLFGSAATGKATSESDIDILILIDEINSRNEEEIIHIGFKLELKCDVIFGFIINSRQEWKKYEKLEMPLCQEVWKYGIPL